MTIATPAAAEPRAHSPFGGSVAARILGCPASVNLIAQVPAELTKPSEYANRGTALHAAVAACLDESADTYYDELAGMKFDDYVITEDDVVNAITPVLGYVNELLDEDEAQFFLEQRVIFPVIGAFGTCDLLVRTGERVHVVDFKFGSGVRVKAITPDGDADLINGQLLYYAAAARHTVPGFFAGADEIVLTILQPQSIEEDATLESSVVVSHAELNDFITAFNAAVVLAKSGTAKPRRGAYCRFCPAKPICPEHTAPLLDLAAFQVPVLTRMPSKEAYFLALAQGLALADACKDMVAQMREQAKAVLEAGDKVPGYVLSAGRAMRDWQDATTAINALLGLGLERNDIVAEEMRSPAQVEKRAKTRGIKVPGELIVTTRSGSSLTREENATRPVPGRGELVKSYAEALKAYEKGKGESKNGQ